jgi:hypothetical protein
VHGLRMARCRESAELERDGGVTSGPLIWAESLYEASWRVRAVRPMANLRTILKAYDDLSGGLVGRPWRRSAAIIRQYLILRAVTTGQLQSV